MNFFQPQPEGVEFLSPEQAKKALETGEIKTLIDVRSPAEYSQARLPGAAHVPLDLIGVSVDKLEKYKNEDLILYCHTQNRSSMAARYLHGQGFTKLKVISGGIAGWTRMGYPLEN
ncbi:MAG: rhodanese-like domain-containing protein [Nitrospinae bacterium]|nr:rhodanese-like domain-containing protein [Nitrospinota bacterium]